MAEDIAPLPARPADVAAVQPARTRQAVPPRVKQTGTDSGARGLPGRIERPSRPRSGGRRRCSPQACHARPRRDPVVRAGRAAGGRRGAVPRRVRPDGRRHEAVAGVPRRRQRQQHARARLLGVHTYWPHLPARSVVRPAAFTALPHGDPGRRAVWAGRRYRRHGGRRTRRHGTPRPDGTVRARRPHRLRRRVCAVLVGLFADWNSNLELPIREFTFIGIALLAATLYAAYRTLTAHADHTPAGTPADRRLSLSGESVGLLGAARCAGSSRC